LLYEIDFLLFPRRFCSHLFANFLFTGTLNLGDKNLGLFGAIAPKRYLPSFPFALHSTHLTDFQRNASVHLQLYISLHLFRQFQELDHPNSLLWKRILKSWFVLGSASKGGGSINIGDPSQFSPLPHLLTTIVV
jgi:hypothetical protein